MVPDEKNPQLRTMKMGNRSFEPCPNNYQCETCPTEQAFLEDMKRVVAEFRSRYRRAF
jgi:hypothetical protein